MCRDGICKVNSRLYTKSIAFEDINYQLSLIHICPDMKIDRNVAVHLKEVGKHTVVEFRREDLQEAHRTDGSAHLEALAFTEDVYKRQSQRTP